MAEEEKKESDVAEDVDESGDSKNIFAKTWGPALDDINLEADDDDNEVPEADDATRAFIGEDKDPEKKEEEEEKKENDDQEESDDPEEKKEGEEKKEEKKSEDDPEGKGKKPEEDVDKQQEQINSIYKKIKEDPENKDKTEEELVSMSQEKFLKDLEESPIKLDTEETDEGDATWKTAVSEFNKLTGAEISIEDDSFDSFSQGVHEHYQKQIDDARDINEAYEGLGENEKSLVMFLKDNGMDKLPEFLNPSAEIDQYLSMDKMSLVMAALKAEKNSVGKAKHTEEDLESIKLEYEENPTQLRKDHATLVNSLEEQKKTIQEDVLHKYREDVKKVEIDNQAVEEKRKTSVDKAIDEMSDFHRVEISKEMKDTIKATNSKKEIDNMMKNPQVIAEFLLYRKFGKDSIKKIEDNAFNRGRFRDKQKMHNVPLPQNGKGSGSSATKKETTLGKKENQYQDVWGPALKELKHSN